MLEERKQLAVGAEEKFPQLKPFVQKVSLDFEQPVESLRILKNPTDPATISKRANFPVALVSMPFFSAKRPSIQLGLLKALVQACGFPATTFHLNLDFAELVGRDFYENLCQHRGYQLGDWFFSLQAFGSDAPDQDTALLVDFENEINKLLVSNNQTSQRLYDLRFKDVPAYLDRLMETINWGQFRAIGFTSTFQQSIASFALARRIKERYPQVCLFFGGANFESEMGQELVRTIDCIDYAIVGEGDVALPQFLNALAHDKDPIGIAGVICRRDGQVTPLKTNAPFREMDELPTPDYSEFFTRAEMLGWTCDGQNPASDIPFESSRGCWWGQKHQCTFCGLNGGGINFRSKSPSRVIDEIQELAEIHQTGNFEAVDNILDMNYFKTVLSELSNHERKYQIFYEVKANLHREQLEALRDAGVRRIQPGIESLSTHVLKLMRKGITAIHNVNTLRWSSFYGISVSWNVLFGFPGETEQDYKEQLALMRSLVHLQPPSGANRIWMERFSPIFFERENFPANYVRAEKSYGYVYPKNVNLEKVAYFFDYEFVDNLPDSTYQEVRDHIDCWQKLWQGSIFPNFTYTVTDNSLQIYDMRNPAQPRTHSFGEPLKAIYLACSDRPQTAAKLKEILPIDFSENEIKLEMEKFCTQGLMMRDGPLYLSLALPDLYRVKVKDHWHILAPKSKKYQLV